MKLKEGKFQKWYAADASWEEIKDLSDLKLVKAYIKESSSVEPSETETATDPTETEPTTVATEPATTATEATEPTEKPTATPTEPSTSESGEASETTSNPFKRPDNIVYGDVNLDDEVTIADAVLLNKYLVKSATLSETAMYAADCNYSKSATALDVNSDDTLAILKLIVGTYESLPYVE